MVPASAPLGRQLTSMTVLADIAGLAYRCWHGEDRKVWMLTTDTATATHSLLAVLPDSIVELDGVPGRDLVATALDTHSAVLSTGH